MKHRLAISVAKYPKKIGNFVQSEKEERTGKIEAQKANCREEGKLCKGTINLEIQNRLGTSIIAYSKRNWNLISLSAAILRRCPYVTSNKKLDKFIYIIMFKDFKNENEIDFMERTENWFVSYGSWDKHKFGYLRSVWISIRGLPMIGWSSETFCSIGDLFGELISIDEEARKLKSFDYARILITTQEIDEIDEKIKVEIGSQVFTVHVKEQSNLRFRKKQDGEANREVGEEKGSGGCGYMSGDKNGDTISSGKWSNVGSVYKKSNGKESMIKSFSNNDLLDLRFLKDVESAVNMGQGTDVLKMKGLQSPCVDNVTRASPSGRPNEDSHNLPHVDPTQSKSPHVNEKPIPTNKPNDQFTSSPANGLIKPTENPPLSSDQNSPNSSSESINKTSHSSKQQNCKNSKTTKDKERRNISSIKRNNIKVSKSKIRKERKKKFMEREIGLSVDERKSADEVLRESRKAEAFRAWNFGKKLGLRAGKDQSDETYHERFLAFIGDLENTPVFLKKWKSEGKTAEDEQVDCERKDDSS